jgi:hypothetical protein
MTTAPALRAATSHGLLGTEMPIRPRLVVLAGLDYREIKRAEAIANRSQARKEPGVSRVVDPMARTYEGKARP